MPKFKVNELISNGEETLWITDMTDTHYIICNQDGSKTFIRIDQIDKQFEIYKYVRSHGQKITIEEYKGKVKITWDVKSKEEVKTLLQYVVSNFDKMVQQQQ